MEVSTRLSIVVILLCFSFGCADKSHTKPTPIEINTKFGRVPTQESNCGPFGMSAVDNKNLWGGKSTFKESVSESVWKRFIYEVHSSGLSQKCQKFVMDEAEFTSDGQPISLNLLRFAIIAISAEKK